MEILIVEDTKDLRLLLEEILRGAGYAVKSAANGVDALEKAKQSQADLIISDILMPKMDGFELCRQLKSDPLLQQIPFIFYTATFTDPLDQHLAMSLGASRFITKPEATDKLLATIKEVLSENKDRKLRSPLEQKESNDEVERMHSDVLARKLEEKVSELEKERDALLKSEARFHDLASHLQSVREEERKHIAREVHDELGQALTGLSMDAHWIISKLRDDQHALEERAQSMIQGIDSSIRLVQRIITELRPALLDDLGLEESILWYSEQFQERTGISCDVSLNMDDVELNTDKSVAIFRIIQESLTNIARHAEATKVTVNVEKTDHILLVNISDNGKGITQKEIEARDSFGVMGIRERVEFFGGNVTITGKPNMGTTVLLSMPQDDKATTLQ